MRLIDADKLTGIVFPTPALDSDLVRAGDVYRAISITPTETRHAHWIYERFFGDYSLYVFDCSVCGRKIYAKKEEIADFLFCPHCGAKMDEVIKDSAEIC